MQDEHLSLIHIWLANDADHQVRLLMERGVYEAPFLSCHPCICTSSLKLKMSE